MDSQTSPSPTPPVQSTSILPDRRGPRRQEPPSITSESPDKIPAWSSTRIVFPETGYLGVAAKFAQAYSEQYESPKEFFYVDCLALIGAQISGRVRADFDLPCQPRLYLLKVAMSAWRRKSTSTQFADKFVRSALEILGPEQLLPDDWAKVVYGVGSAEGLAAA